MSEMIERVAEATIKVQHPRRDFTLNPIYAEERAWGRLVARAALTAAREPTEAMLEAARLAPTPMVYLDSEKARVHLGVKTEWQAMIDAALNPGDSHERTDA